MNRNLYDERIALRFNKREESAFSSVYSMLFTDLCYYANNIFQNTEVEGCDIVHDVFLSIWSNNNIHFKKVINIKAYAYVCIKNRYKDYLQRNNYNIKFQQEILHDEDMLTSQIIETEALSIINAAINTLPSDYAQIFKLYIEGWSVKEIATKLGLSKSYVYNKKKSAFDLLRKKQPTFIVLF